MKKQLLLLTIAFFLLTSSTAQQYTWHDISSNIPGDSLGLNLSDVHFINANEGWITSSMHTEIYHTTDGGLTFEIQTTQSATLSIYMFNENEGYSGGYNGTVNRTTDGGDNWDIHGSIGGTLTGIHFPPGSDTGYCCGDGGRINKITSSGVTQMISNLVSNMQAINFSTANEGWVCGENAIRHYTGGAWTADQSYPTGGYNSIYFVPGTTQGWCVGGGAILHTIDGYHWQPQTNPYTMQNSLSNVFFLNINEGWSVGHNGTLLHTTNGGASWSREAEGFTTNILRGVFAVDEHTVYVSGNNKTLLKYTQVSGIGDEVELLKFEIFPNPAVSVCNLQSSVFSLQSAVVEIYDLNGKKLLQKPILKGRETVEMDVSSLRSGIYFCKVSTEEYSLTKKIIIQK